MSCECRQSPLKTPLNTFRTCHKTHSMVIRYGSLDTEGIPNTQDPTPLDLTLQGHPVPEVDNYPSDEYCEETDTHCPLANLLEQLKQLNNQFASLKSNTHQSTPTEELSQLTDKLQHLTMVLPPAFQSSEELVHKTMQAYTDTLHATPRDPISPQPRLFKVGRLVHGYKDYH